MIVIDEELVLNKIIIPVIIIIIGYIITRCDELSHIGVYNYSGDYTDDDRCNYKFIDNNSIYKLIYVITE